MAGDLFSSFVKRRLHRLKRLELAATGHPPGQPLRPVGGGYNR